MYMYMEKSVILGVADAEEEASQFVYVFHIVHQRKLCTKLQTTRRRKDIEGEIYIYATDCNLNR